MAAEKRRAKAKKVISRPIRHPNFKNLSNLQAIAAMHDADVGACMFRPSEKGTDQITLTIKVQCRQAAMRALLMGVKALHSGACMGR